MIAASFLCKHLLIDWRWEKLTAEKLLDYDLAANNGNWQWAGRMRGAMQLHTPSGSLIRLLKTQKFDKDLQYIKMESWFLGKYNASYRYNMKW